jgi:hypothetical protein
MNRGGVPARLCLHLLTTVLIEYFRMITAFATWLMNTATSRSSCKWCDLANFWLRMVFLRTWRACALYWGETSCNAHPLAPDTQHATIHALRHALHQPSVDVARTCMLCCGRNLDVSYDQLSSTDLVSWLRRYACVRGWPGLEQCGGTVQGCVVQMPGAWHKAMLCACIPCMHEVVLP